MNKNYALETLEFLLLMFFFSLVEIDFQKKNLNSNNKWLKTFKICKFKSILKLCNKNKKNKRRKIFFINLRL